MRGSRREIVGLCAIATAAGCAFPTSGIDATGGVGGSSSSSSSGAPASTSIASSSSSGTGGSPTVCSQGEKMKCYDGPPGTADVGACKSGNQLCAADGKSYGGACTGEVVPTEENCASGVDQNCDGHAAACTGKVVWSKTFGDNGSDVVNGMAIDSKGNVIVAGAFTNHVDFGGTALTTPDHFPDAYVAKYDKTGALVWVVQFGDAGEDMATSVAVDANDDIAVTGVFSNAIDLSPSPAVKGNGIFVAKLKADGSTVWGNGYVGDTAVHEPEAVAVSADGHVAIVGDTAGDFALDATTFSTGINDYDGFVAVFASDGALGWVRPIRDAAQQRQSMNGVAFDSDGSLVVTGEAGGDVDFGDGMPVPTHGGGTNVAIARYDASGDVMWKQLVGDNADKQFGTSVAIDAQSRIALTGRFQGMLSFGGTTLATKGFADGFVAHLDKDGNALWATSFGGKGALDGGLAIAVDAYGIVVSGYYENTLTVGTTTLMAQGGWDALAIKLDAEKGSVLWAKGFGGGGDDQAWGVAVDPLGASVIGGFFTTQIDLGGGTVKSKGDTDAFFVSLAP